MNKAIQTSICTSDAKSITIRGLDLVNDIIGKRSFSEMLFFQLADRFPEAEDLAILDMCLVTLMEHGITPSSMVTRIVLDNVSSELQVAVAAGLNTVSSVFVGTMEGAGRILKTGIESGGDLQEYCARVVADHLSRKVSLPGFGHHEHKPDDPRPSRMLEIAGQLGRRGKYCALLEQLSTELDRQAGRHLTINATGATAAVLLEAGLQPDIFRGIAVVARAAGLVCHVREERERPIARKMWNIVTEHTEFVPPSDPRRT
ncbi:citryl-CoA lyase (plasmid) [Rhizorhabdus wittichii DC-6]|nr:citryl-CoA lyase [Rhizorhabdus wittichii DC-6]